MRANFQHIHHTHTQTHTQTHASVCSVRKRKRNGYMCYVYTVHTYCITIFDLNEQRNYPFSFQTTINSPSHHTHTHSHTYIDTIRLTSSFICFFFTLSCSLLSMLFVLVCILIHSIAALSTVWHSEFTVQFGRQSDKKNRK